MIQEQTQRQADGWDAPPEWKPEPLPEWDNDQLPGWDGDQLPEWEPLPEEWETATEVVP